MTSPRRKRIKFSRWKNKFPRKYDRQQAIFRRWYLQQLEEYGQKFVYPLWDQMAKNPMPNPLLDLIPESLKNYRGDDGFRLRLSFDQTEH